MEQQRAAYMRCLVETKNLFRKNASAVTIPTEADLARVEARSARVQDRAEAQKVFGQGTDVTAPLALVGLGPSVSSGGGSKALALVDSASPTHHPKWKISKVLVGHTGWVRALDVDPENEWFASGGNDRLIKIWDLASGELKLTLTGHIHAVRAVKVSARHPYLFSCGEDHMIKCWDLEQNQVVRQYRGHMNAVYDLAVHPQLDILASGGRDATVRIWDMRTQDEVMCLRGHSGSVLSVLAQQHEPQVISGGSDKMVRCWDLRTGKSRSILTHHSKSVRALAAHPRQWSFVSCGADAAKVFEGSESVYKRDFEDPRSIVNTIAMKDDPASAVAVLGCDNGLLQFYDFETGRRFQSIESTPVKGSLYSEAGINVACFDKSETRLLTGESDKTVRIWREVEDDG